MCTTMIGGKVRHNVILDGISRRLDKYSASARATVLIKSLHSHRSFGRKDAPQFSQPAHSSDDECGHIAVGGAFWTLLRRARQVDDARGGEGVLSWPGSLQA